MVWEQLTWSDEGGREKKALQGFIKGTLVITPYVVSDPKNVQALERVTELGENVIVWDGLLAGFIREITSRQPESGREDTTELGLLDAFSKWIFRRRFAMLTERQLYRLSKACKDLLRLFNDLLSREKGRVQETVVSHLRKGKLTVTSCVRQPKS